jgi:orotidine-5'-phosphate decarboxylase
VSASAEPRVVVALDYPQAEQALAFADQVTPALCRVKVGKELFTRAGPAVVQALVQRGFDVFLDLKFHDIPNTVAGAVRAAADLGVWMLNVHALGGPRMLQAAAEARQSAGHEVLLIGVTVLTSMDAAQLHAVGLQASPEAVAAQLAALSAEHGMDGVVCSAQEVAMLRTNLPGEFVYVTPGIRPAGAPTGDQHRIVTPREAVQTGASYLVVGRPVTQSDDPCQALLTINAEIADIKPA